MIPIRKNITPTIKAIRPRKPINPNMMTANPKRMNKFLFSMLLIPFLKIKVCF